MALTKANKQTLISVIVKPPDKNVGFAASLFAFFLLVPKPCFLCRGCNAALQFDPPITIQLPPKETKNSERRRIKNDSNSVLSSPFGSSSSLNTSPTSVLKRSRSAASTSEFLTNLRSKACTG
ncbi:hypothetical protein L596_003251 [Steinernema carpocapsae]|uniref:Uncharacterized protein n=1 Tax=Steinernema carpocapsae TaxID=34508 RepID=A0A4V6YSW0_STECR|nr:hypothetical protein L596_003251 [Steinernema carpocapsae]